MPRNLPVDIFGYAWTFRMRRRCSAFESLARLLFILSLACSAVALELIQISNATIITLTTTDVLKNVTDINTSVSTVTPNVKLNTTKSVYKDAIDAISDVHMSSPDDRSATIVARHAVGSSPAADRLALSSLRAKRQRCCIPPITITCCPAPLYNNIVDAVPPSSLGDDGLIGRDVLVQRPPPPVIVQPRVIVQRQRESNALPIGSPPASPALWRQSSDDQQFPCLTIHIQLQKCDCLPQPTRCAFQPLPLPPPPPPVRDVCNCVELRDQLNSCNCGPIEEMTITCLSCAGGQSEPAPPLSPPPPPPSLPMPVLPPSFPPVVPLVGCLAMCQPLCLPQCVNGYMMTPAYVYPMPGAVVPPHASPMPFFDVPPAPLPPLSPPPAVCLPSCMPRCLPACILAVPAMPPSMPFPLPPRPPLPVAMAPPPMAMMAASLPDPSPLVACLPQCMPLCAPQCVGPATYEPVTPPPPPPSVYDCALQCMPQCLAPCLFPSLPAMPSPPIPLPSPPLPLPSPPMPILPPPSPPPPHLMPILPPPLPPPLSMPILPPAPLPTVSAPIIIPTIPFPVPLPFPTPLPCLPGCLPQCDPTCMPAAQSAAMPIVMLQPPMTPLYAPPPPPPTCDPTCTGQVREPQGDCAPPPCIQQYVISVTPSLPPISSPTPTYNLNNDCPAYCQPACQSTCLEQRVLCIQACRPNCIATCGLTNTACYDSCQNSCLRACTATDLPPAIIQPMMAPPPSSPLIACPPCQIYQVAPLPAPPPAIALCIPIGATTIPPAMYSPQMAPGAGCYCPIGYAQCGTAGYSAMPRGFCCHRYRKVRVAGEATTTASDDESDRAVSSRATDGVATNRLDDNQRSSDQRSEGYLNRLHINTRLSSLSRFKTS